MTEQPRCKECNAVFLPSARYAHQQVFCNMQCKRRYHHRAEITSGRRFVAASMRQETKTCLYCKSEFRTSRSVKTHCSRTCSLKDRAWKPEGMKAKGVRARYTQRRREAQRNGDKDLTTYTIWKAESGRCRACSKQTIDPTTPRKLKPAKRDAWASLDHIVPLSSGGTHTWANAQLLCYPCNSGKVHTDAALYGRGGQILILESGSVQIGRASCRERV
jgi:5-methylcytosine-specific restriction endonuclease McrA